MSKDGGPAFPEVFSTFETERNSLVDVYSAGGMSLRDYFAAKALPLAHADYPNLREYDLKAMFGDRGGLQSHEIIAALAYRMADAMLKKREK